MEGNSFDDIKLFSCSRKWSIYFKIILFLPNSPLSSCISTAKLKKGGSRRELFCISTRDGDTAGGMQIQHNLLRRSDQQTLEWWFYLISHILLVANELHHLIGQGFQSSWARLINTHSTPFDVFQQIDTARQTRRSCGSARASRFRAADARYSLTFELQTQDMHLHP